MWPELRHLIYPFPQLPNSENEIQRLVSLFSINAESQGIQIWLGGILCCGIGNHWELVVTWLEAPGIPLSTTSIHWEWDSKPWESVLPKCRLSGNTDDNGGGFVAVPSGIVRDQLGSEWKQMKYPFSELQNTENEIQSLWSLLSPSAESAGTQIWIGVDLLLFHLESLGASGNLIWNTWNTPFHDLNPPIIRINCLRVCSPPNAESEGTQMRIGMDSLLCCLELLEISWDQN